MGRRYRKKGPKTKAREKADKALTEFVRVRDRDTCQHCQKKVYGVNSQCSHVLPKGKYRRLAYDPLNVKLLCNDCHKRFWHEDPIGAKEWFYERFPDRAEYLEAVRVAADSCMNAPIAIGWYEQQTEELRELTAQIERGS